MLGVISDMAVGVTAVYALFVAKDWKTEYLTKNQISLAQQVLYQAVKTKNSINTVRVTHYLGQPEPALTVGLTKFTIHNNEVHDHIEKLKELAVKVEVDLGEDKQYKLNSFIILANVYITAGTLLRSNDLNESDQSIVSYFRDHLTIPNVDPKTGKSESDPYGEHIESSLKNLKDGFFDVL